MFKDPYADQELRIDETGGLRGKYLYRRLDEDVIGYNFIEGCNQELSEESLYALKEYSSANSVEIYKNFLDWLYKTFKTSDEQFRKELLKRMRLTKGMKVLITGVGIGSELKAVSEAIGTSGELHIQDLSSELVRCSVKKAKEQMIPVVASVSDAMQLPYETDTFDVVFHFGGINLFPSVRGAIAEMNRVAIRGTGRIVFGDEGIADHMRGTESARIAINNNPLWEAKPPLEMLPTEAEEIRLEYILGNCFYLISYRKGTADPAIDIDVPHVGWRGGTMRTRYFGKIEGIEPELRVKLESACVKSGISVHDTLNRIIGAYVGGIEG